MSAPDHLCILIGSCDKYRALAEWTASRLDRMWDDHPPIFFCGLTAPFSESCLPVEGDPRDWMGVALQAVESLLQRGFRWTYLILDDLPPVSRCNAEFLNHQLPQCAEKLDATLVSMLGWGQHRAPEGPVLGDADFALEQIPLENRWRFSLHPGLWRLEHLRDILQARCRQFALAARTPWNFERHHASDHQEIPRPFLESCYRIHGRPYATEKTPLLNDLIQSIGCFIVDVALFVVRKTQGNEARQKAAAKWLWPYCYYRGPYPLFWSGVMRQGREGAEWTTFLKFFNPSNIRNEWHSVRQKL